MIALGPAAGHLRAQGDLQLRQGVGQGRPEDHVQDGRLDGGVLHRRPDLRGHRPGHGPRRRVLHRHHLQARRHRPRRARRRGRRAPPLRPPARAPRRPPTATCGPAASTSGAARARSTSSTPRPSSSSSTPPARAATTSSRSTRSWSTTRPGASYTLRGLFELRAPTPRPPAGADRRGRAGQRDRQAVLHRRHELRLDLGGGPRDPRHRHEPPRRQVQHRRGRRGPGALRRRRQRRPAPLGGQAGGLGPLRRDLRVPHQRRRPPDQDGPGRQARRGRPAAGLEGLPVDRQDPALHAGRGPHQPAAAPRHLLDRGPQAAHPRPQERQPRRPGCT